MSSGDIDDVLAPTFRLEALITQHDELRSYLNLAWGYRPIRTFFIPWGAGISSNGQRVYISYDIQTIVNGIECESALVRHETTEWGLRQYCGIGEDYLRDPSGHRLGNRAEHDRVVVLLNREDAWEIYSEIIDPQVIRAERQEFSKLPIPLDLALYPYDTDTQDKLLEAMHSPRSQEEWAKLNRR